MGAILAVTVAATIIIFSPVQEAIHHHIFRISMASVLRYLHRRHLHRVHCITHRTMEVDKTCHSNMEELGESIWISIWLLSIIITILIITTNSSSSNSSNSTTIANIIT
uniref:Uncharacterized protein n=1 Tax=Anopheles darlingi TaxID=43151 RepID=A0A2M4D2Z9_ANODA